MSLPTEAELGIALEQEDPNKLFEIIGTIGRGTFGSVYKARNKDTGEVVAVKQVPAVGDTDELKTVIKEIQTLEHCQHPNIVQYRGTYRARSSSELWITMEYCQGGSFDNILKVIKRPISEKLAAFVTRQMLEGLAYLHKDHHIHRDIKGGNVLLTDKGEVKLTDFGVSAQMMTTISKRNSFVGTLHWMAPETIQEREYDERADIWSLGITLMELLELKPPNFNMAPARLLFHIPKSPPPTLSGPHDRYTQACHNFLRRCLTKNPETRPTAAELLTDPFVCNLKGATDELQDLMSEYNSLAEGLSTARKYLGQEPDDSPRPNAAAGGQQQPAGQQQNQSPGSNNNDSSDDPTFIVDPNAAAGGGVGDANTNQYLAATEAAAGMAYHQHLLVDIPLVKLNEVSLAELDVGASAYLGMDAGLGYYGQQLHRGNSSQAAAQHYFDSLDPIALLTNRQSVGPPPAPPPKAGKGGKSAASRSSSPAVTIGTGGATGAQGTSSSAQPHVRTRSNATSGGPSPLTLAAQQYTGNASGTATTGGEPVSQGGTTEPAAVDEGPYVPTVPKHLTHSTKMLLHSFDYHSQGKFTAGVTEGQVQESISLSEKYGSLLKSTLQI